MNKIKNAALMRNWPSFIPWFILAVVFWSIANTTFRKDYNSGIIEADAKGYYAYLPAIFIYHDLNFKFYYQIERVTYSNPNLYYQYLRVHNNKTINKYYVGTALCLAPFFLVGHGITMLSSYPADGYSYWYTLMVHIGALFYLMLGIFGLRKLLLTYNIKEPTIAWVLLVLVFGTNLYYYVVTEFAMSHVYSFALITWFCFFLRKYFDEKHGNFLFYSSLLLGMIILIRPVNVLILFAVPFLAGNYGQLKSGIQGLLKARWFLLYSILCFVLILSIQLFIYWSSTGSFILYSYKDEGFDFLHPQLINFLFSYRKGMFIYTPVLFLSLFGFIYIYRLSRFQFFSLIGFLFALVYIFSSWHMWYYGGSFSQRVMIDFYAFFAILLAFTMDSIKNRKLKTVFYSLVLLMIVFCQIQTYQYRRNQIHWSDMNKEKYWEVFMRVDKL